ncbi:MAG: S-layer homology domain-containing protein, partial [bacterium]|nr:S-layer homology domain-containing protein [bacterium]
MWRMLLLAVLLTMMSVGLVKAAPFPDVPDTHWASSAVQQLKAKGILEGYPDGLYRGKRAASRYEMAMVASRIVAKLEQLEASLPDFNQFATKEELAAVK